MMITFLLLVAIVLLAIAIVTFIRAHRQHVTIATVIHGEVDAAKKRITTLEAKIEGGTIQK